VGGDTAGRADLGCKSSRGRGSHIRDERVNL
jgi:hypothetical protein